MIERLDVDVDVAIVGAGPAGLGAALALRHHGVARVIVFEREGIAGGAPRHCGHPTFGLREFGRPLSGPRYAARLVAAATRLGIDIRLRHTVVSIAHPASLTVASPAGTTLIRARRILIATGARETPRPSRLISGQRPVGVMNTGTLQAMLYLRGLRPFRRPVIVGTELVGLSAVWTCIRHGIRPVAMIEESGRTIAPRWFGVLPLLSRIPVLYGSSIDRISGNERVESVDVYSRRRGIRRLNCDGVLLTGRFLPETSLLSDGIVACDPGSGGPSIDQYGRCSQPQVFAAGNVLRAIESAAWCHREGSEVGARIAADLVDKLPHAVDSIPIIATDGIKWTLPQRLAISDSDAVSEIVHLRVDAGGRGRLVVGGGAVPWQSRRRCLRIEQRLQVLVIATSATVKGSGEHITIAFRKA